MRPSFNLNWSRRLGNFQRRSAASFCLTVLFTFFCLSRARAQNHVDYRFESYGEDGNRISVDTQSALFDQKLTPWLSVKGEYVYDIISGATPIGAPPPNQVHFAVPVAGPLSSSVPVSKMFDIRHAGDFEPTFTFGRNRITPLIAYSEEHDYVSEGLALNYSVDLNEKNTTLNFGAADNHDRVLPATSPFLHKRQMKNSYDFLAGINQLINPHTTVTANLSYGRAMGYLADPYKGMVFDGYPQFNPNNISLFPEKRPHERNKYIGYFAATEYFKKVNASLEGSYRFSTDSFGIQSHTLGLSWLQKLGKHLVVTPEFRYYYQTAANFYHVQLPGLPAAFGGVNAPAAYSADYRLSKLDTFTGGLSIA